MVYLIVFLDDNKFIAVKRPRKEPTLSFHIECAKGGELMEIIVVIYMIYDNSYDEIRLSFIKH